MGLFQLTLVALGLSMDAFAVAICKGLAMQKATIKQMLIVGLYFGLFQAAMPAIGYFLGAQFADFIQTWAHWIAFALLSVIGGKMVVESLRKKETEHESASLLPGKMLPLAIATSIDALATGVTFAFLRVNILPAVLLIGTITLILSAAGTKIGNLFGARFKSKAELAGGIILIAMGLKILLEHLAFFD